MSVIDQPTSLIRVIEIWRPDPTTGQLSLAYGSYGPLEAFREAMTQNPKISGSSFAARVYQERTPLVFADLYETDFERFEEARAAGLTSGIAWPLIDGDEVTAVILLLCDQSQGASGAFELWKREERGELGLQGEYYANLQQVSTVSQFVKFPHGAGLPGRVWEESFPRLLSGLGRGSGFARGSEMATQGIRLALGLPIMRSTFDLEAVVLMFSSAATPLAQAIEIWKPEVDRHGMTHLHVDHADYGRLDELGQQRRKLTLQEGAGFEGMVFRERFPHVEEHLTELPAAYSQPLFEAGIGTLFSFPIFVGPNLVSVVTLLR